MRWWKEETWDGHSMVAACAENSNLSDIGRKFLCSLFWHYTLNRQAVDGKRFGKERLFRTFLGYKIEKSFYLFKEINCNAHFIVSPTMLEAWKSVGAFVGKHKSHKDNQEPETRTILKFQVHEKLFLSEESSANFRCFWR